MIRIIDYGMGNLRNVVRACREIGVEATVTSDPDSVRKASSLILPGVGAFGEAVRRIDALGLRGPVLDHVAAGLPLLGICLGMQLLLDSSEESPGAAGFGLIAGLVRKLGGDVKVPHIGWNDVLPLAPSPLFPEPDEPTVGYFVHSYYVGLSSETVAVTEYGVRFAASVRKGNVYGVQFHPEKSQVAGLNLLRRFSRVEPVRHL
jgi:glutamine amidotransferase